MCVCVREREREGVRDGSVFLYKLRMMSECQPFFGVAILGIGIAKDVLSAPVWALFSTQQ